MQVGRDTDHPLVYGMPIVAFTTRESFPDRLFSRPHRLRELRTDNGDELGAAHISRIEAAAALNGNVERSEVIVTDDANAGDGSIIMCDRASFGVQKQLIAAGTQRRK
jgi:hypothetical protein